jgi:molybdate transport system substrate-binding protein
VRRPAAAAAALALAVGACGIGGGRPTSDDTVLVFAAASLNEAMKDVGAGFSKAHGGTHVEFNFGGSQALASQILQGAPADVLAAADEASMRLVRDRGAVAGDVHVFAHNRLEIAVRPGNPKRIHSLTDLAAPGTGVLLCAPDVPCGRYARQALDRAGVQVSPLGEEPDVKGVLGKVRLGEADAGIVYVTDVAAAGSAVEGVDIPDAQNVVADYPVGALAAAGNPAGARALVAFLLSAAGQELLVRHGFARA